MISAISQIGYFKNGSNASNEIIFTTRFEIENEFLECDFRMPVYSESVPWFRFD